MSYHDTTVIIPTLNEVKNIGRLVRIIRSSYEGVKIVVADDGSSDGTKELVIKLRNVKLLDRSKEAVHGITASVIDAGKSVRTEFFVVIDGDLQHPPGKIGEFVAKLRSGSELVIGTRKKIIGKWSLQRRLQSKVATYLARIRLLKCIEDPMSGFFGVKSELFRKALVKEARFEKEGYKILFDLLKYMPKRRVTSKVYYDFDQRKAGKSKIRIKHMVSFLRSVMRP